MSEPTPDVNILKLIAAVAGAVVSLRFVPGTFFERLLMTTGGAAFSYFGTSPIAEWQNVPKSAEGLLGFVLGLFSMMIVAKVFEYIQSPRFNKIIDDAVEALKRKWGA